MFGRASFAFTNGRRMRSFLCRFGDHAYGNLANASLLAAGFILVCMLTSATYILNDIADLVADRLHHSKTAGPVRQR